MSAKEIIDGHDAVSGVEQLFDGVGADIARPAGNQNIHRFFFREVQGLAEQPTWSDRL